MPRPRHVAGGRQAAEALVRTAPLVSRWIERVLAAHDPPFTVTQYLTPEILQSIFPAADKVGEVEGTPPAVSISKGGRQLGYVFSTWDVTQSKGFSNRALILLVGGVRAISEVAKNKTRK